MNIASLKLLLIHFAVTAQTACPGGGPTGDSSCDTGLPIVSASSHQLSRILTLSFGIIAAVAVLFIVIGGLRFVLSEGDPQDTVKARNTMIYAVVGLVVAISAEAIVVFVLNRT